MFTARRPPVNERWWLTELSRRKEEERLAHELLEEGPGSSSEEECSDVERKKTIRTQRRCPVTMIQAWKRTLLRPLPRVVSRARCHWPEARTHRRVHISGPRRRSCWWGARRADPRAFAFLGTVCVCC